MQSYTRRCTLGCLVAGLVGLVVGLFGITAPA